MKNSFAVKPLACALLVLLALAPAQARMRVIERSSEMKIDTVRVAQGMSENMKLDSSFADIVVGDPDIADVVPLTDKSLYILGKRLGRTSVSLYDADKQLLGTLDVEVSYDTTALSTELRKRLPDAKIKVSSVNGRILLTGSAPDAVTLDQAVLIAKQFGAEVVPSVSISRSQQVMLEVRFLEVSRDAGRELSSRLTLNGAGWSATTGFTNLQTGSTPFGTISGTIGRNGRRYDDTVVPAARRAAVLLRHGAEDRLLGRGHRGDRLEYFGGLQQGLGPAITSAAAALAYPRAWALVTAAIGLGLVFYLAAVLAERLAMPWQRPQGEQT